MAAVRDGASEAHEFVVLVPARDAGQAVERARTAVQAGGPYAGFSAVPASKI